MMVSSQVLVLSVLISCIWALEFPSLLPIEKRQDVEPGTPLYECHANCGITPTASSIVYVS
jgi:hypothetical protein